MRYDSPAALRAALEHRLHAQSLQSGVALNRLRRRVVFERIASRIDRAEPGRWVVKGGMALEVRLADRARTTKDLDLGLREDEVDSAALSDRTWYRGEFLWQCPREPAQTTEHSQQRGREIDSALAPSPVPQDHCEQFTFGQRFDAERPESLSRALACGQGRQHYSHSRDSTQTV
jgi:hypothetical protein